MMINIKIIYIATIIFIGVQLSVSAHAQNAIANCGINSSVALAQVYGNDVSSIKKEELHQAYPQATVAMLDVKRMCQRLNLSVTGIKSAFVGLLKAATPSIVNLKNPDHFLVLLDGDDSVVRIIDGDNGALEVVPRSDVESRFTGYALIIDSPKSPNAPVLQMPHYDEYQTFTGINQKAKFDFPVQNTGKSPLSVEIIGTSCGCTAAVVKGSDPKKLVLAPGKSSNILVNYDVHGVGVQQQSVTLKTNDPRHPVVYLTIRGELPPQLALSPPAFYVQQSKGDSPHKALKVIGPKGTAVKKIWSDLLYLKFNIGDAQFDNERVLIPIQVTGFNQAAVGNINGKIWLELQNGQKMSMQVRGVIE